MAFESAFLVWKTLFGLEWGGMIPLPAAYSSSCDIASKTRLLLFSEARGRLPNNFTFFFFFFKKATLLGKKNEVNPIFLLMWDWWTKMAWRAGRHQTDWTSSGFCYFTSKQCGRCDFHFNLSDYLIFLSAISPPSPSCTYILSVNVLVQSCDIDFRINSK